jgi:hypothetical protein
VVLLIFKTGLFKNDVFVIYYFYYLFIIIIIIISIFINAVINYYYCYYYYYYCYYTGLPPTSAIISSPSAIHTTVLCNVLTVFSNLIAQNPNGVPLFLNTPYISHIMNSLKIIFDLLFPVTMGGFSIAVGITMDLMRGLKNGLGIIGICSQV